MLCACADPCSFITTSPAQLFGLESEFSTHSLMRGLSGGQKVKTVLGAAMWNNPHMLVLDEPTNYLDRCAAPWVVHCEHPSFRPGAWLC